MKENTCERCPGCGRHCRRDNLHCNHGVAYFEKQEKNPTEGPEHHFIHMERGMKNHMTHGKISQEAFFAALNASEQVSIDEILNRLAPHFDKRHAKKYPGRGF